MREGYSDVASVAVSWDAQGDYAVHIGLVGLTESGENFAELAVKFGMEAAYDSFHEMPAAFDASLEAGYFADC